MSFSSPTINQRSIGRKCDSMKAARLAVLIATRGNNAAVKAHTDNRQFVVRLLGFVFVETATDL